MIWSPVPVPVTCPVEFPAGRHNPWYSLQLVYPTSQMQARDLQICRYGRRFSSKIYKSFLKFHRVQPTSQTFSNSDEAMHGPLSEIPKVPYDAENAEKNAPNL